MPPETVVVQSSNSFMRQLCSAGVGDGNGTLVIVELVVSIYICVCVGGCICLFRFICRQVKQRELIDGF